MRLISLLLVLSLVCMFSGRAAKTDATYLPAPDGTTVEISRDTYGVPHITGETEAAVFFGQGFAVAEDRLVQLETYRRSAEGKLAEWFGKSYLPLDQKMRTMLYSFDERQATFRSLSLPLQTMIESYASGINAYLDSIAVDSAHYKPREFAHVDLQRWTVEDVVAVTQFTTSVFGQFGGEELTRLAELETNGRPWFESHRPLNDASAPTTMRGEGKRAPRAYHYSGMKVQLEPVRKLAERWKQSRDLIRQIHMPLKFGSFAVLISAEKSSSGKAMLLGCPQMGSPQLGQANTIHEVELSCPTLHVSGMTIAGMPGVLIGRNDRLAWTFTSGYSDNSDMYIDSTETASYSRYYYKGTWHEFETLTDTIYVEDKATVFTHYRTAHGPVVGADLENHQVFALKTTFRGSELDMLQSLYESARAQTMERFEQALVLNPMSFNVFCAADDGRVHYWHIGKYQNRADGIDPRLPHRGDGSEEWAGFIPFNKLPSSDQSGQDYFANWNNKPASWWDQGDNVPWMGGNHVTEIEDVIKPADLFSYEQLTAIPEKIGDHGTYQQAFELGAGPWRSQNIVPPGQSAFVAMGGEPNSHTVDQWSLHSRWQFKEMRFAAPWNAQQNWIAAASFGNSQGDMSPPVFSRLIADRYLESEYPMLDAKARPHTTKSSALKTRIILPN
ncbi:MAG TPA: penicillin acylase family protein [bacterium]